MEPQGPGLLGAFGAPGSSVGLGGVVARPWESPESLHGREESPGPNSCGCGLDQLPEQSSPRFRERQHTAGWGEPLRVVPVLQASSTAVLPLGLRGQALSGPCAVGHGIVPGDVENRVVWPVKSERAAGAGNGTRLPLSAHSHPQVTRDTEGSWSPTRAPAVPHLSPPRQGFDIPGSREGDTPS